jgi:hypothetical protein
MPSPLEKQLRADTDALAMPQGRRVGQVGHDKAREFLIGRLTEIGLEPFHGPSFELPYPGQLHRTNEDHTFTNLGGVIPGRDRKLPPLLLGAHYDSVIDAPCADDNATSVALNLAIAERMMAEPLERDLIIALYDAEEPPYFLTAQMGSTRFFEDHCADLDFAGAIITDLIGHDFALSDLLKVPPMISKLFKGAEKIVFMTGSESDGVFPNLVEEASKNHPALRIFPTLNSYVGSMSDHHAFAGNGKPFLFFSCGQGRYYHHEEDTLDWINFTKLAGLTDFIHDILTRLDATPAGKAPEASDPDQFEIRMIKKAIGPVRLKLALKAAGLPMPKDREGLDQLIGTLTGTLK